MLDILNQILSTLLSFVPRLVIIRPTHRGIKFQRGKRVVELKPGLHWFWPLVSQVETLVTARQTVTLRPQSLETLDGHTLTVSGFVVFFVSDVTLAAGERNWDVDSTVDDVARSTIASVVKGHELSYLRSSDLRHILTRECRKKLRPYGVGVKVCGLTDFCVCRTYRLIGGNL